MPRRVQAAAVSLSPTMVLAWQQALDVASEFGAERPWETFSAAAIVGVRDPVSGEIDWCTIMGHRGEVFGVAMYPADAGYATLQGAVDEEIDEFDAAFAQLAITLQFESSATILPATRKVFKAIGRTYRGAHAWPELCEHEPGFFPAPLRDEAQLQRTANTLRGLVHLLPWARRDPAGGAVDDGDRAWVTAPPFGPGDLQLQTLPVVRPAPVASPPFDEIAVRRLVGGGRARSGVTWFLDWFTGHDVIDGPEAEGRPYFLCHLLLLDTNSGMLLACELARLSEVAQGLQQVLLQTCERFGLPERLIVRRETVAETLQPLAQRLGIGLNRDAKSVGITRRLYAEITSFLGR